MGMTIAEKIIARAAGLPEVHAGEIHTVELDYLMSNDGTSHLTVDKYNKLKNPHIEDVKKLVWIVDHNVPCDSPKTAASQKKMRDFAKEHGIDFYEGEGVCHQVMLEKYVSKYDKTDKFYLCGFNIGPFDNQFLRAWFLRCGEKWFGSYFWSNYLDCIVLATPYLVDKRSQMKDFKQSSVAEALGVKVEAEKLHDAFYDIELSHQIYDKVCGKY